MKTNSRIFGALSNVESLKINGPPEAMSQVTQHEFCTSDLIYTQLVLLLSFAQFQPVDDDKATGGLAHNMNMGTDV